MHVQLTEALESADAEMLTDAVHRAKKRHAKRKNHSKQGHKKHDWDDDEGVNEYALLEAAEEKLRAVLETSIKPTPRRRSNTAGLSVSGEYSLRCKCLSAELKPRPIQSTTHTIAMAKRTPKANIGPNLHLTMRLRY